MVFFFSKASESCELCVMHVWTTLLKFYINWDPATLETTLLPGVGNHAQKATFFFKI